AAFAVGSFLLILTSYVHILQAMLQKGVGMQKSFAFCTSHLTVVSLFSDAGALTYLVPQSRSSKETDKILALLYAIVTPMLNPINYSLRNREFQ
ncbi:O2A25 protein, partial [Odontophorus gujanensis]|nr:O2A25 protein [Odontophorus gujanensis]